MKKYSIGIISQDEKLWSLYAWNKSLKKLCSDNNYTVEGFWTCEEKFVNIRPEKVSRWYYDTFGVLNFIKLGLFFILFKSKNFIQSIFDNYRTSFFRLCREYNVNYYSTTNPNSKDFIKWVKDEKIDILIIMVGHILKEEVINATQIGIINKHAGLLPSNKGVFPYFWAKIKNEPQGISFHMVDEKIDNGRLLFQEQISNNEFIRSMISFYLYTYQNYDVFLLTALNNLIMNKSVVANPSANKSYQGLPQRSDYEIFSKRNGKIITYKDLFKLLTYE
tara:strand:+ start:21 stop:851 length:831 start_codon:yes stop_codon:yes gene_type:complete